MAPSSGARSGPKVCRLCLRSGPGLKRIFSSGPELRDEILQFAAVSIDPGDALPQFVCLACTRALSRCLQFKLRCEQSDASLRRALAAGLETQLVPDVVIHRGSPDRQRGIDDPTPSDPSIAACINKLKELASHPELSITDKSCKKVVSSPEASARYKKNRKPIAATSVIVMCELCQQTFSSVRACERHMKIHLKINTRRKDREYVCEECGKRLISLSTMNRHMMAHKGLLPFQCQYCPYRCTLSSSLITHTRRHTGERPYACLDCPKTFGTSSARKKHTESHYTTPPVEKKQQLLCDQCPKVLSNETKLLRHKSIIHLKIKPHQCDICQRLIGTKKGLLSHRKNKHNIQKRCTGSKLVPEYFKRMCIDVDENKEINGEDSNEENTNHNEKELREEADHDDEKEIKDEQVCDDETFIKEEEDL